MLRGWTGVRGGWLWVGVLSLALDFWTKIIKSEFFNAITATINQLNTTNNNKELHWMAWDICSAPL